LKNANEQLKTADPKSLDIENVEEGDGQYIEMVCLLDYTEIGKMKILTFCIFRIWA
jgi:hypothetical protein